MTDGGIEAITESATTTIAAPIGEVFAAVTDATRMGEWSPECVACRWVGGATVVTETFSHPPDAGWQKVVYGRILNRQQAMTVGMQATLERIKQSLEG